MKERIESYQPITLEGLTLKVFQNRGTPKLHANRLAPEDPLTFKAIHTHFTYEVFFVCNGALQLVTEEETRNYQNSILIIPPQIKHYSFNEREGNFCLLFSVESSPQAAALTERLGRGVIELPLTDEIAFYIRQLDEKNECSSPAAAEARRLLTALIFNHITDALLPRKTFYQAPHTEHIDTIESYINGHLLQKLTLTDVAENVALSTKQITRIIKKKYGMTFSALVADKRLATAKMLLKNSDLPVREIAERTFPGSETYFYTLFKKKCGISPLVYRKKSYPHG